MAGVSRRQVRDELVALAHRGLDVERFSLAAARAVGRVVPHDGVCVLTLDPATLLPTGEVVENGLPDAARPRMAEIEIGEPDFLKFTDLARRPVPADSLSHATDGELDRSARHRELKRPHGLGDELRSVLVGDTGAWAGITLMRENGAEPFSPGDAALVASLSPPLLEGLRRALLLAGAHPSAPNGDIGLVLLDEDNAIEAADAPAQAWLADLAAPQAMLGAVATRARAAAAGQDERCASARIRTETGRWLRVRGTLLAERAVVILEPAARRELAPLIAEAYGLTERERAITALVARGLSTEQIAAELFLSPYTVQDHLKAIFEKVGVSTRGALVAHLFFDHYAPALQ
jgi:DNA-binding CsgD family transcriptional regulator